LGTGLYVASVEPESGSPIKIEGAVSGVDAKK
jgi:hypothetical protein